METGEKLTSKEPLKAGILIILLVVAIGILVHAFTGGSSAATPPPNPNGAPAGGPPANGQPAPPPPGQPGATPNSDDPLQHEVILQPDELRNPFLKPAAATVPAVSATSPVPKAPVAPANSTTPANPTAAVPVPQAPGSHPNPLPPAGAAQVAAIHPGGPAIPAAPPGVVQPVAGHPAVPAAPVVHKLSPAEAAAQRRQTALASANQAAEDLEKRLSLRGVLLGSSNTAFANLDGSQTLLQSGESLPDDFKLVAIAADRIIAVRQKDGVRTKIEIHVVEGLTDARPEAVTPAAPVPVAPGDPAPTTGGLPVITGGRTNG